MDTARGTTIVRGMAKKKHPKGPAWAMPRSATPAKPANTPIARAREALTDAMARLVRHPGVPRLGDLDLFEVSIEDQDGAPGARRTVHAAVNVDEEGMLISLIVATGPRSYAQLVAWLYAPPIDDRLREYPGHAVWRADAVVRGEVAPDERLQRVGEFDFDGEPRVVLGVGEHRRDKGRGLDAIELTLLAEVARTVELALADPELEVPGFLPTQLIPALGADGEWNLRPAPSLTPDELSALEDSFTRRDDLDDDEDDWGTFGDAEWEDVDEDRRDDLVARLSALPVAADRSFLLTSLARALPRDASAEALSLTMLRELVLCDPVTLAEQAHQTVDGPELGEEDDLDLPPPGDAAADTLDTFVRLLENAVGALPGRLVVEPADLQRLLPGLVAEAGAAESVTLVPGAPRMPAARSLEARVDHSRAAHEQDRDHALRLAAVAWLEHTGATAAGVDEGLLDPWFGTDGAARAYLELAESDAPTASVLRRGLAALAVISAFEPTPVTKPWLADHRASLPADLGPAVDAWAQLVPDFLVGELDGTHRSLVTGEEDDSALDGEEVDLVLEDEDDSEECALFVLRVPHVDPRSATTFLLVPLKLATRLIAELGEDRTPARLRAAAAPWLRAALIAKLEQG